MLVICLLPHLTDASVTLDLRRYVCSHIIAIVAESQRQQHLELALKVRTRSISQVKNPINLNVTLEFFSTQYAWAFVGLSVTNVITTSITVVIGFVFCHWAIAWKKGKVHMLMVTLSVVNLLVKKRYFCPIQFLVVKGRQTQSFKDEEFFINSVPTNQHFQSGLLIRNNRGFTSNRLESVILYLATDDSGGLQKQKASFHWDKKMWGQILLEDLRGSYF
ncbi:hypothetical protein L1887_15790 [Cichorium endivia]|nr:hypothetical protein L1887_15790 [Cichorium endivia]